MLAHEDLTPMAVGSIYGFLAGDTVSTVRVGQELDADDVSANQVMTTTAVMAAAMLVDACGGEVQARELAARWFRKISLRELRKL